jgi:hypothetical protein
VPSLKDFMKGHDHKSSEIQPEEDISQLPDYLHVAREENKNKKYFIETHGCQMNVADSEIVQSILENAGFSPVDEMSRADVILVNTCAIREGAEKKIWNKIES